MLTSERYIITRVYTQAQGLRALQTAQEEDVERGGIYDARSASITIWSDPWTSWAQQAASVTVGTIYVAWHTPDPGHCTVYELEVDLGWTRDTVERHVTRLFGQEAAGYGPSPTMDSRKRGGQ